MKKKKNLKDPQDQKKNKIKKSLLILGYEEFTYVDWLDVINHRNMIKHIQIAQIFLKAILDANFDLI